MNDNINEWTQRAKAHESESDSSSVAHKRVKVIRKESAPSIGQLIMQVADKIRPHIAAMCDGVRDNGGMLLQPAHIRGIALEVAERMVKEERLKAANQ